MRKIFIFLMFVLFISYVSKNFLQEMKISDKLEYYKTTTKLNVRSNEGMNNPVSFVLKKDEEVQILSKNYDWFRVKYFNKEGYVNSKFLKLSKIIPNLDYLNQSSKRKLIIKYLDFTFYVIIGFLLLLVLIKVSPKIRKKIEEIKDKKLLKTITNLNRGDESERDLALRLLKFGIPKEYIFHDLYLKKENEEFSQIDLVAITDIGILVFEVKNYSGSIYGNNNYSDWIQSFYGGKSKYYFQNPINQNDKHIINLKNQINNLDNIPFFSIIVFYGSCQLKNIKFVPENVYVSKSERIYEVLNDILQNKPKTLYNDKNIIIQLLKNAIKLGGNEQNRNQHKDNVVNMLGSNRVYK